MSSSNHTAVLIPVKAFELAKGRLAPVMDVADRASLARAMGETVIAAAQGLEVFVACDDEDVATWATGLGAEVVWTPETGLNGALQRGAVVARDRGAQRVMVVHADLPFVPPLVSLVQRGKGMLISPDRRDEGTNLLAVPLDVDFPFAFGPGSFARHLAIAGGLNIEIDVLRSDRLAWDIDEPEDLLVPRALAEESALVSSGMLKLQSDD